MRKILFKNKSFFNSVVDFKKNIDKEVTHVLYEPHQDQLYDKEIDFQKESLDQDSVQLFLFFDLDFPINKWKEEIINLKENHRKLSCCFLGSGKEKNEWTIQKESFCDLYIKKPINKDELSFKINDFLEKEKEKTLKETLIYLEKAYITFNKTGKIIDYSDHLINDLFDIKPEGKTIHDFLGYKNETRIVFNNWLKSVWGKKIPYDDALDLIPNFLHASQIHKTTNGESPKWDTEGWHPFTATWSNTCPVEDHQFSGRSIE